MQTFSEDASGQVFGNLLLLTILVEHYTITRDNVLTGQKAFQAEMLRG